MIGVDIVKITRIENTLSKFGEKFLNRWFHKDEIIASFHRPHPKKEAKPYQVRDARTFLRQLGVEP